MRKKLPFLPPPQEAGVISCFSCGQPMRALDETTQWCEDCQVMEERKNYVSHLRLASGRWWGANVSYLDHGTGHYPSPA